MSIWTAIEQVQELQARTHAFLSLYQQYVLQTDQNNEFLPQVQVETGAVGQWEGEQWEGEVLFQPRRMQLSRVFQDICVDGGSDSLSVQLHLQGQRLMVSLNHCQNSYNLSNFSSFNNQKEPERTGFDFKELLTKIQERTGRRLSRKGIECIIGQLEQAVAVKEGADQSDITRHSLKTSCIEPPSVFDFEIETQRLRERKDLINMPHLSEKKELFEESKEGRQMRQQNVREKENNLSHAPNMKKKEKVGPYKEIRIVRKNKSSLMMAYSDARQLQHFCISNKISNREKEKISRAIRESKPVVCLD